MAPPGGRKNHRQDLQDLVHDLQDYKFILKKRNPVNPVYLFLTIDHRKTDDGRWTMPAPACPRGAFTLAFDL
jgi:hypothetical protein